jgi:cobyrinic acid a,c-diamide synthase
MKRLPRIMVAGGGSESGKTMLTCALLAVFQRRGLKTAAFKCGPDYIDPMFHREIQGAYSSNLDLFMLDEDEALRLLIENNGGADIAVIEGVMGFYDGVGGSTAEASSWRLSEVTKTPVILVENCKGQSLTVAAHIKGVKEFRRNRISAVLLNNAGEGLFEALKPVIERETGLPVHGRLAWLPDCTIKSRHLGLVTAAEIDDLRGKIARLADEIEKTVDIDAVLSIARSAPPFRLGAPSLPSLPPQKRRIAVARDRAFCFYYEDGLNLLRKLGAELIDFSPLNDSALPPDLSGLILGGGYPELYAAELAANGTMLASIKNAVEGGLPTIAECGGFMYLHRELEGTDGKIHRLAGVIDAYCKKTPRLVRFGYAEFTANTGNLLCEAGETLRGHEFHYWDSSNPGSDFTAVKPGSLKRWQCITANKTLFAGFPHFHLCSKPKAALRFLSAGGFHAQGCRVAGN